MIDPAAALQGVSKRFGATLALDGVDFDVAAGEIHAIVGENGAGKSTLIRILGGVHRPDRGIVRVDGPSGISPARATRSPPASSPSRRSCAWCRRCRLRRTSRSAIRRCGALGPIALIDRRRMREEARAVLAQLDFDPDPDRPVHSLGFAERQLVAIAKALHRECRVFILDEPTAALEQREIERLFAVLARMKAQGTAIVYISHRLDEVVAIADRCTVMRDGRSWPSAGAAHSRSPIW